MPTMFAWPMLIVVSTIGLGGEHPNAWRDPYYWGGDWGWGYCGWGDLCGFWGLPVETDLPEYDYGNNVIL